ncbi:MAG: hypothetical protein U9Q98_11775 [Bacteroidota bacterium]|nr:hypothetical protein [Bacteroidota bacterium]
MKITRQNLIIIILSIIALGLISYLLFFKTKNTLRVNVSDIDVEIDIRRFDKDLFADYTDIEQHTAFLEEKYPRFFLLFTQQIITIGHTGNKRFYEYFDAFLTDYSVEKARKAVENKFRTLDETEATLKNGFRHYKYYYPEKEIPGILTFIAGFNHSIVTDNGIIGIGLDKYLGADSELYAMMDIPVYAVRKMQPEFMPVDCMYAWAKMEHAGPDTSEYLVHKMIYEGKLLYFLDAMYPDMHDSIKMGYAAQDLAYCQQFEKFMWDYLVSEELLFSTDYLKRRKFIGDAPFTYAFGKESPGRAAVWLGWQIVKAYAENNNMEVKALMNENDYQKILNESEYRP